MRFHIYRASWKAQVYVGLVITAAAVLVGGALSHWTTRSPGPEFNAYYVWCRVLAALLSRQEIKVFGTRGVPIFLAFVFLGIRDWSLPATLVLAATAASAHFFRSTTLNHARQQAADLLFAVASFAIATAASYDLYHLLSIPGFHLDPLIRLGLAATLLFALSTFSSAVLAGFRDGKSLRLLFRDGYFGSLPAYVLCALISGLLSFVERFAGWQSALFVMPFIYLAYRLLARYILRTAGEKKHAEEMAALHLRTIEALALAIEAKDHSTHDHVRRVQVYAIEIGKALKLGSPELEALRTAAVLHDIGKLAVPEHIMSKPGKLTREEFEKIKIHPIVGAEILERVRFPYPVTPIVRSHHEHWDGTGYPDGLHGEEIPIGARILAAVDALDAMASDRQYRRAVPLSEAMRRVAADSGTRFDPKVIAVLESRCVELDQLSREQELEPAHLSTPVSVSRCVALAAGLEQRDGPIPDSSVATSFLSHIAAARHEVQTLFELAQDLGSSLSLNETLSLLAIRLKRMVAYDSLAIFVQRENVLRPEYVSGDNLRLFSSLEIPLGQGLSGWVAENRKPIVNGNPALEPGYRSDDSRFTAMRSALSIPLHGLTGVVSVLTLYNAERDSFTRDHLRILLAIAPKVGHAIENALKYQQAESSAATDYVTGLPNSRSLFLHLDGELARCRRTGEPLAVLVCDMNGFKAVNDRYGHLEGNRVLREVAVKIKQCCREYDYVARMGGDEFVLVLPGLRMDQALAKCVRLNSLTRQAGQEICGSETLSLSAGVAVYPDDGKEAEQLLSEADRRMYIAKQTQKQRLTGPSGYDFDHLMVR